LSSVAKAGELESKCCSLKQLKKHLNDTISLVDPFIVKLQAAHTNARNGAKLSQGAYNSTKIESATYESSNKEIKKFLAGQTAVASALNQYDEFDAKLE